ncbi:hypothetical protein BLA29_008168, partial [Euroglyphus maynei]
MVLTSSSPSTSSSATTSVIRRSKSSLDTWPKYYLIEIPRRVAFNNLEYSQNMDNNNEEDSNPFRPGSELSREADIIVNLIKEGKPITPTGDISINNANNNNLNVANSSQTPKKQQQQQQQQPHEEEILTKQQQFQTQTIL